jgi:cell division protein FtsQ
MVRNVAAGHTTSGPLHSQRKARRRFDISVGLPGTEVRLPNLPQFAISWRWLSAVLAIVLGVGLYQVWNAAAFRVSGAEISGLQHLTTKEVNTVLGLKDRPVFSLDADQLKNELLQAFPEFSSASVHIGLPSTVAITVTERVPVIAWMVNGSATLVDQEGMAFPARGDISALGLPVVEASAMPPALVRVERETEETDLASLEGASPVSAPIVGAQPFLKPEFILAVMALRENAPQGVPLLYDAARGFGWRDPGGWDVYFGDAQDMAMKLDLYQAIINRLDDKEETLPSLVSVENVHAPYYRPR